MTVRVYATARVCITALILFLLSTAGLAAQEIVLHSTDVATIKGNWTRVSTSGAASGVSMSSTNNNWSSTDRPDGSPDDYFEASFTAQAWTPYRVWVRLRATSNSKWNESVWVQFGDSLNSSGSSAYRIGSTSGVLVNLEDCSGCGVSGWGWSGGSWWAGENSQVQFSTAGTKTIRIQTREDGAQIDQIVLSPSKYLGTAPGLSKNDTTILARSGGTTAPVSATATAKAIPGTIQAEDFDAGTSGSAYYDRTSGNIGGQYRSTNVDIETSAEGGYDVGWTESGEWLNYTVNVAAAGDYTMEFRVASLSGGGLRATFGGVDETGTVSVGATGGWQKWTTVRKTVNLSSGTKVMRIIFDGGVNLNYVKLISGTTSVTSPESGSGALGGTAWAVPGTVQAEDFDLGGSGVAYRDNSSGNSGGKYRTTDVDIESTSGGGYNLAWVGAGEWLKYTVNVRTAGTYTLTARVASSGTGGTFHVEFNGANKTGTMTVPNTGGWQSFRDVTRTVTLSAGVQTMRVVFDSNGSTGAIGNVNYFRLDTGSTSSPTPTATTSGKIRIMTWNVHFGKNSSNVLNLDGQAKLMADSGAHVILLQEASTWDGDQPNSFPAKLKALTGYTWSKVWSSHNGTGSGEGTLILTKLPVVNSSIANYYTRGFSRVAVSVNGVTIDIFNGHLTYNDLTRRTNQLKSWMAWMDTFSGPEVAGGDFNAWWGESWIKTMETKYSDTWQDYTGSDQNGYTHNSIRFDYLFRAFDSNYRLTPTNCWVISTSLSDHRPLVADYAVK